VRGTRRGPSHHPAGAPRPGGRDLRAAAASRPQGAAVTHGRGARTRLCLRAGGDAPPLPEGGGDRSAAPGWAEGARRPGTVRGWGRELEGPGRRRPSPAAGAVLRPGRAGRHGWRPRRRGIGHDRDRDGRHQAAGAAVGDAEHGGGAELVAGAGLDQSQEEVGRGRGAEHRAPPGGARARRGRAAPSAGSGRRRPRRP
jgi:hypothetical protein